MAVGLFYRADGLVKSESTTGAPTGMVQQAPTKQGCLGWLGEACSRDTIEITGFEQVVTVTTCSNPSVGELGGRGLRLEARRPSGAVRRKAFW